MIRKLQDKFPLIPEGDQVVRVKEVIDKDYEKFDKLTVIVEDGEGTAAQLNFNFVNEDGSPNDGAENAYTFMCRALLNDQTADEVDTNELVGKFALAEVMHTTGSKGGTFIKIKKWSATDETFAPSKGGSKPAEKADKPASTPAHKKTAAEIIAEAKARKAAAGK